jgi:hypothetical protein
MRGFPQPTEAAPYYFVYIDRIQSDDILGVLASQLDETLAFLNSISEDKSLHRYTPDKWSFRQVLNHINDTERVFVFRAFWFGRGFDGPLPSFDEKVSAGAAHADEVSWARHLAELRAIRQSTLAFFQTLPEEAWMRSGIASDQPVTVRALAYITAGHVAHHLAILRERYLSPYGQMPRSRATRATRSLASAKAAVRRSNGLPGFSRTSRSRTSITASVAFSILARSLDWTSSSVHCWFSLFCTHSK